MVNDAIQPTSPMQPTDTLTNIALASSPLNDSPENSLSAEHRSTLLRSIDEEAQRQSQADLLSRRKYVGIAASIAALASLTVVGSLTLGTPAPASASAIQGIMLTQTSLYASEELCKTQAILTNAEEWRTFNNIELSQMVPLVNEADVLFAEDRGDVHALVFATHGGEGFTCVVPQLASPNENAPWISFGLSDTVQFQSETFESRDSASYKGLSLSFKQAPEQFVRYESTLSLGTTVSGTVQNGFYVELTKYQFAAHSDNQDSSLNVIEESDFWPKSTRFFEESGKGITVQYSNDHEVVSKESF